MPEDESETNFCLRVAAGDLVAFERLRDMRFSEVWEYYAHQVLMTRIEHRP